MSRLEPVALAVGRGLAYYAAAVGVPLCLSLGLHGTARAADAAEATEPESPQLRWAPALGTALRREGKQLIEPPAAPDGEQGVVLRPATGVGRGAADEQQRPLPARRPRSPGEVDEALSEAGPVSSRAIVGPTASGPTMADEPPAPAERGWRLAPIFWSGNLESTASVSGGDIGATSRAHGERLNLAGNSYVWQPWFARVSGTLALGQTAVSAESKSNTTSTGFGGRINLFPQSRFPIEAYFDTTSISTDSGGSTSGGRFNSQMYGIANTYRPEDESYTAAASLNHTSFDSGDSLTSSVTTVAGSFAPRIQTEVPQTLGLDGNYSSGKSNFTSGGTAANAQDYSTLRLRATHNINLDDYYGLTLASDATVDRNTRSNDLTTTLAQAQSTFNWQPLEDLPLRLTGSIRGQHYSAQVSGQDVTIQSLNGQVSTSYNLDDQWSVFGGVSAYYVASETKGSGLSTGVLSGSAGFQSTSATTVSANGGVSYRGLPVSFDSYEYTHGASASAALTAQTGGGDSTQSLTGSLFHGLSHKYPLGKYGPLFLSATQSYSGSLRSGGEGSTIHTLVHGISASWSLPGTEQGALTANLSATDSRQFGDSSTVFQSISGGINGTRPLSAYSSAGLSGTVSFSRRLDDRDTFGGAVLRSGSEWVGSALLQANYRNSRLFSVPLLDYSASYNLTARSDSSNTNVTVIQPVAPALNTTIVFERANDLIIDHAFVQYVTYRLGRLSFRLSNNFSAANDGRKSASLFLSVNREMGGVLNF